MLWFGLNKTHHHGYVTSGLLAGEPRPLMQKDTDCKQQKMCCFIGFNV
jgi:hypothetical protein